MKNENFSHFGLSEENQDSNPDNRIEPSKQAKIDGYGFGDRLLEGVMFIITIQEDGTLKVESNEECADYMKQLNVEYWNEKALEFVLGYDLFEGMNGEDINLFTKDGIYNFMVK